MKRYEKYKDSKIEWIGEVPDEWRLKKISHGFRKIGSGTTPTAGNQEYYLDGEYYWLQTGDLTNGAINTTSKKITKKALEDFSTLRFYKPGSLVIAMYGATIGKVGLLNIETTTNQACCVLSEPESFISRYVYYWFTANKEIVISLGYGGGQPNISQDIIKTLRLPCPSLEEQTVIVNYLDEKTAQIDNLIRKKQKLIELLKEERTAVINEAVSGEGKNWQRKKLKYLLKPVKGSLKPGPFGSDLKNSDVSTDGPVKVYTQRNVIDNDFKSGEDFISEEKFRQLEAFEIDVNDILVTTRGTIGRTAVFPRASAKGILHPCLIRMQIDESKVLNDWLICYFNDSTFFQENVKLNSNSTIIDVIYGYTLREVVVPVPSVEEQMAILQQAKIETHEIDTTISKIEKEIELMQEYRTALISEVVTGKIKVF